MTPKVRKKFTLCIRFQLSNSFVNTKVPKKCIRFQLGNSFGNTKVPRKFTSCILYSQEQTSGFIYNPPTPALAKAGAAPGTTAGVELQGRLPALKAIA